MVVICDCMSYAKGSRPFFWVIGFLLLWLNYNYNGPLLERKIAANVWILGCSFFIVICTGIIYAVFCQFVMKGVPPEASAFQDPYWPN